MLYKNDESEKEFICRQCGIFLDANELIDGQCPICETDEDIFINDINNDLQ